MIAPMKMTVEPTVVLDTNAFLDVFSCHDLFDAYDRAGPGAPIDADDLIYRRARAREGILVAILFHHRRAISFTLREARVQLMRLVKPPEEGTFPGHFTTMFVNFVCPTILGEWTSGVPYYRKKKEPAKSKADDFYVKFAKKNGIPLISQEGYGPKGMKPIKKGDIRSKAAAAGVQVFTTRDYYKAANRNETADIEWFLNRFDREATEYIEKQRNPAAMENALLHMFGAYRHVLRGESKGQTAPAKLVVPP
jgi:hypothetical protein